MYTSSITQIELPTATTCHPDRVATVTKAALELTVCICEVAVKFYGVYLVCSGYNTLTVEKVDTCTRDYIENLAITSCKYKNTIELPRVKTNTVLTQIVGTV